MKVLCIDTSNPIDKHLVRAGDMLTVGEIYTVEAEIEMPHGIFYYLTERPDVHNRRVRYAAWRFVPLDKEDLEVMEKVDKITVLLD